MAIDPRLRARDSEETPTAPLDLDVDPVDFEVAETATSRIRLRGRGPVDPLPETSSSKPTEVTPEPAEVPPRRAA